MEVAERNRAIKKVLRSEFKKVSVKGDRGTAYGWVDITIYAPKHEGECEYDDYRTCNKCRKARGIIEKRVYELLEGANLLNKVGVYESDWGSRSREMIIDVMFEEV